MSPKSEYQLLSFTIKTKFSNAKRHYFRQLQKRLLYSGWQKFANNRTPSQPLPKFEFAEFVGEPLILSDYLCKVSTDKNLNADLFDFADSRENIFLAAQDCNDEKGYWPISLSSPRMCEQDSNSDRCQMISTIVPGIPSPFSTEGDYYDEYRKSYYALSHKKGGWDCNRHIEILMNGAIPLMPDASAIPKYSMVHYPKGTLHRTLEASKDLIRTPSVSTRENLKKFFNENLTSVAMVNYMLRCAKVQNTEKILFIDLRLPFSPDHLSNLSLIGLKQAFATSCIAMQPVRYLYKDWKGISNGMYGGGFGYVRCLPAGMSDSHRLIMPLKSVAKKLKKQEYDLVVFGSIMRNLKIFENLKPYLDPTRTIVINGEDLPPSKEALNYMKDTRCHVFVRSIE